MTAPNGCESECCRAFPLNLRGETHEEQLKYLMSKADDPGNAYQARDLRYMLDMLIPAATLAGREGPAWTCRHLLDSGLCGAYEARPAMCSGYPSYGRGDQVCEHEGCDYCDVTPVVCALA